MNKANKAEKSIARRHFIVATAACVAQPLSAMTGHVDASTVVHTLLQRPCRANPNLNGMPEFLCRAWCVQKPKCLNHELADAKPP
jgi:hypothetical protein